MTTESPWQELEKEDVVKHYRCILNRLMNPWSACTVFDAIKNTSMKRLLLIQVPKSTLPSVERIPQSVGFNLSVSGFGEEPATHSTLVLTSNDVAYDNVFTAMIANISQALSVLPDERTAVEVVMVRLSQWQRFFEKQRFDGLNEENQRGIFGELVFIREHLLGFSNRLTEIVSGWTGPKNRHHDFQFGDVAIEAKTTIGKQHQRISISSEQQLDDSLVGSLYIFHISMSPVEGNPNTLPSLVRSIRSEIVVSPQASSAFNDGLFDRGYLDAHEWKYSNTGYVIRETAMYHVAGDFPRITERNLPSGVGDLKYSVSVSECRRHGVEISSVLSRIQEALG